MHDKQNRNIFYKIIQNAANLLLYCAGYLDDIEASQKDDKDCLDTYYAVDNDIINMYLLPESSAKYLDVFKEGEKSISAISLALMLGEFLFAKNETLIPWQKEHKCRFLIIPPHDDELIMTLSVIHNLLLNKRSSIKKNTYEKLSQAFENFANSKDEISKKEEILNNNLRGCAPDIIELFNPYHGPQAALQRFALLPETTLQRIDKYQEQDNKEIFTFPLLDPIRKEKDRKKTEKLFGHWEKRLKSISKYNNKKIISKRKKSKKPIHNVLNDVEVLATIEHVNKQLQHNHIGKQVVLITGSPTLFKAANKYRPYKRDKRSFADLYLRHPQAFLSHEKFFFIESSPESSSITGQSTFNLVDWLNLFFPSNINPPGHPRGRVERKSLCYIRDGEKKSFKTVVEVMNRSKDAPNSIERLRESWKNQVASVANRRYAIGLEIAKKRGIESLAESLKKLENQERKWDIIDLQRIIYNESLGSISTLYSMSVWVGLWSKAHREQCKGIPALRFDGLFEEINSYYEDVIKKQLKSVHEGITAEDLEGLIRFNNDLMRKDEYLYLSHIIHALAFAIKGHWHATLTLSEIAIEIINNNMNMEDKIKYDNGREAYYLACVAKRRSSTNRIGLNKASEYLEKAKRSNKRAKKDIRFKSESLAIRTIDHYLSIFCENKININKEYEDKIIVQVFDTIKMLRKVLILASTNDKKTDDEKNKEIKRRVLRQTLTNYLSLLLIANYRKWETISSSTENVVDDLKTFNIVFKKDEEEDYKQEDDPISYLIYNVSVFVWHTDRQMKKDAKKNALESIDNWDKFDMPYEEERLKMLKRILTY